MNSDISYDPVSVIDEKEAIGETAKIFKDIRETMNIPLITSIWRGLAEIDDSLKKIWTIARPIYETQNPEKKLKEIIEEIKKRSPIWKKEHYHNDESDWLKGNPIIHEKN